MCFHFLRKARARYLRGLFKESQESCFQWKPMKPHQHSDATESQLVPKCASSPAMWGSMVLLDTLPWFNGGTGASSSICLCNDRKVPSNDWELGLILTANGPPDPSYHFRRIPKVVNWIGGWRRMLNSYSESYICPWSAHKSNISTNPWAMKYLHLASEKLSWSLKWPFLIGKRGNLSRGCGDRN